MTTPAAKRARYVEEPVFVDIDGEVRPYVPTRIVKAREAYAASLDIMYKHLADVHVSIVEIIADKYKLDAEEMFTTIKTDPRYTGLYDKPVVNTLGYFKDTDAPPQSVEDEGVIFEDSDADVKAVTTQMATLGVRPAPLPPKKKITVRGRPKKGVPVADVAK